MDIKDAMTILKDVVIDPMRHMDNFSTMESTLSTDETFDEAVKLLDAFTKSASILFDNIPRLRELVHGMYIPSPTCPEYIEHHKDIQTILYAIDSLFEVPHE